MRTRDCAPKFDPVKGSIDATLAGVEALRFELSEREQVAYARVAALAIVLLHLASDDLLKVGPQVGLGDQ